MIDDLTRVVLNAAMAQSKAWQQAGLRLRVAVNVSMDNLSSVAFADFVAGAATAAGVAPQDIVLEVTESRLMLDQRAPLEVLTRLRLKRFRLSIDDFGTGHSSLTQLRDIPFDELKIDQSFVRGAWHDDTMRAIYDASLSLGKHLGMEVVAEGVEDRDDWDMVRHYEMRSGPGFFHCASDACNGSAQLDRVVERAHAAIASGMTMKGERAALQSVESRAKILVASDNPGDAALVKKLLMQEFEQVFLSIHPDLAVQDFECRAPDVLVLAFNTLEKAERHYLGLYRRSAKIHLQPHRTVILCNKDEVDKAYQACRKQYFDDYILFWPMTNDAPRLLMSVHHSLRDLIAISEGGPSVAEIAVQARRLAEFGSMLGLQIAQGSQRIEVANRAMKQAEQEIGAALDGFSSKLAQGDLSHTAKIQDVASLKQEIKRFKQEEIGQRFRMVAESVLPIQQWADEFSQGLCTAY